MAGDRPAAPADMPVLDVPPDVPPVDVAVVVPTYRRPDGLRRLLDGLSSQTLPFDRWEAVIVDDGSGPDVAAAVDRLAGGVPFSVRVLHQGANRGQAAARNRGWRSTSAPVIAFVDDDCVPEPGWLAAGLAALSRPGVGVVQGRTVRPAGSERYRYTPLTVVREVLEPSPWFEGCNLFLRREALDGAGGFDEGFGDFAEDTRLGWSVLGAGWERGWAGDAVVTHELGERPVSWHLRIHWREGDIVRLAARHPGIRSMLWRPWAVKRENALFAAAVLGLLAAVKARPAALLTFPYLLWLQPGRRVGAGGATLQVSAHAASLAGKLVAGVQERTVVL